MSLNEKYDYLIVGAGLAGAVFAYLMKQVGKKIAVIEKRNHIGGNLYCENVYGINVHKYGPHIFHTNNEHVWIFMNSLVQFRHYHYCPLAYYHGELYHLPFNMNTFYELWGIASPMYAKKYIAKQRLNLGREPQNLKEQAVSQVGWDIYEKLISVY